MLDIKKIKENPDAVKAGLKAKEVDCDAIVDRILELDVQVRGLKTSTETKTAQKNKLAKENGKLFGQKKGAEKKGEDTAALDAQIEANKAESIALGLSVRQAELLCKNMEKEPPKEKPATLQVNYVAECEKTLSKHLGRGVKIVNGKRKGRFELEFYGAEDLQNLLEALLKLQK